MNKKILVCDGTLDGIFTAIYKAYDLRYGHENIKIVIDGENEQDYNLELFSEYIIITTDFELSLKVSKSIQTKISQEAYEQVCKAALSCDPERGEAIYRFLILGFHMGRKVLSFLSNDAVIKIFELNRNVGNESHHFLGFLRFKEVGQGVLLAIFKPKNNILTLVAPHFSDRLNNENFIIYDEGRKIAMIHGRNRENVLLPMNEQMIQQIEAMNEETEEYENLWSAFYDSICIEERKNEKLTRNNLPLRFRSNMTEFKREKK